MTVNTAFAFLIGVRLSLNLPNARQEREKSQCRSPGSPRCKSPTGEADPRKAARDCPESDSCPLGEGQEKEDLKLIDCVKLEALMRSQAINAVQGDHEKHLNVMEFLAGPVLYLPIRPDKNGLVVP